MLARTSYVNAALDSIDSEDDPYKALSWDALVRYGLAHGPYPDARPGVSIYLLTELGLRYRLERRAERRCIASV